MVLVREPHLILKSLPSVPEIVLLLPVFQPLLAGLKTRWQQVTVPNQFVEEPLTDILGLFRFVPVVDVVTGSFVPRAVAQYAHMGRSITTVLAERDTDAPATHGVRVGRNDPCPCGSGKKYKKCCRVTVH